MIFNQYDHELPAAIMVPNYSDNSSDLTNTYVVSSSSNIRSFTITKQWAGAGFNGQTERAKATFRLYRTELDSDGKGYTTPYTSNDTSDADPASSATAAAKFQRDFGNNDPALELVREEIVQRPDTSASSGSSTITWDNLPIFAPSGKLYAYYAVEMTADMPGYTVVLNGEDSTNTTEQGSGPAGGNTKVEITDTSDNQVCIGVAFANGGISLSNTAEQNKKEETFRNTYNGKGFLKLEFTKEWDPSTSTSAEEDAKTAISTAMLPPITKETASPADPALKFKVYAEAPTQPGKVNKETVSFTETTDYSISVTQDQSYNTIWHYTVTFKNPVPMYSLNGNPYTYYVEEELKSQFVTANYRQDVSKIFASADQATIPSGATGGTDNENRVLQITNPFKNSLKGSLTIRKQWDDFNNDYGMREGSVYFDLYYRAGDSGTWLKYQGDCELNKNNGWKMSFSKLPTKDASGEKYQYQVRETKIVTKAENGTTTLQLDVPDASNKAQNGKWKPNGTSQEDPDSFYEPVGAGNYQVYNPADIADISTSSPTKKIVNQLDTQNATVSLKVVKKWEDDSNKYGLRPANITVTLQKSKDNGQNWTDVENGTRVIKSTDVSSSNPDLWIKTFTNLPKYHGSNQTDIYQYRAVETKVGGTPTNVSKTAQEPATGSGGSYSITHAFTNSSTQGEPEFTSTITNTLVKNEKSIHVKKIWNDEATSHEDITVALYSANYSGGTADSGIVANESSLTKLTFEGSMATLQGHGSTCKFENLPKYNKDGYRIIYYVKETSTGNFMTRYTYADGAWPGDSVTEQSALPHTVESWNDDFHVHVINTPLVKVEGTKVWEDENNAYRLRPDNVTLTLQKKKVNSDGTLIAGANWENVTLTEVQVANSNPAAAGVYDAGSGVAVIDVKASPTTGTPWKASIDKLPLYAPGNGLTGKQRYIYRLAELSLPNGYTRKTDGSEGACTEDESYVYGTDAGVQTSQVSNYLIKRVDITVEKVWNKQDGSEKKPVTVTLFSRNFLGGDDNASGTLEIVGKDTSGNGVIEDGEKYTQQITSAANWIITFENLPAYNKEGKEIVYYVKETKADGNLLSGQSFAVIYQTENAGSFTDVMGDNVKTAGTTTPLSLRIINTPYTQASVTKTWSDEDNKYGTRPQETYVKLQRKLQGETTFNDVTWGDIPANAEAASMIAATPTRGSERVIKKLDHNGSWQASLDNLPHYKEYDDNAGIQEYEYRFLETDAAGNPFVPLGYSLVSASSAYAKTNNGTEAGYQNDYVAATGYQTAITNTLITKSITVVKTWDDNSDAMGIRPADIRLYVTEDTSAPGSTGSFNNLFLGGVATNPYGDTRQLSNENLKLQPVKSTDGNTWTYTFTGLPRYDYGNGANPDGTDLVYKVTEDVKKDYTISNNAKVFRLEDYYETTYPQRGNRTEITNKLMPNDGMLLIEKAIETWTSNEYKTTYAFPFSVTLERPDGSTFPFAGTYYLYDKAKITGVSGTVLWDDALQVPGTLDPNRITMNASDGTVRIPEGKVAVLIELNSGHKYRVTENPSATGYEVYKVENGTDTCTADRSSGTYQGSGGTADTNILEDDTNGGYYGLAAGQIPDKNKLLSPIVFTNRLMANSHFLKIENVTEDVTTATEPGGRVKIYKTQIVVDTQYEIGTDDYTYVNTETPYIEEAMSVEFTPDTTNGWLYGDYLMVYWWQQGEDISQPPQHSVKISGYVTTDASGKQVPYTGTLVRDSEGKISVIDEGSVGPGKLLEVWRPLLTGTPFQRVTVLEGSVVLTLANDVNEMPARTLVQVWFKQPEPPAPQPQPQPTPPGPAPDPAPTPNPEPEPEAPAPTGGSAAVTATKEAELTGSLTSFTSTAAGTQKEEPDTAGASTARGSATGDEMARELPRRLTILMIALIIAYRNVQDSARPFRKKRRLNSP